MNDKFVLNPTDASYSLSIEIQMPIENVLLQVSRFQILLAKLSESLSS